MDARRGQQQGHSIDDGAYFSREFQEVEALGDDRDVRCPGGCPGSDTAWQMLLLEEDAYISWNDGLRSRAPTVLLASGRLQMVSFTSILAHGSPVALLATKMPEFLTIVSGERVLLHSTELSSWHNR